MFDPRTETTRLRNRDAQASAQTGQATADASSSPVLLAQTRTLTAYPTAAQRFFACTPVAVLGSEIEGGPGAIAADTGVLLALNLGTAVPPVGTTVLLYFCGNRWVFLYN